MTRRTLLGALATLGLTAAGGRAGMAAVDFLKRPIPATGEMVPVIGMGSWITFDVGSDPTRRAVRAEVLRTFFGAGGTVIDSSPMYGTSEAVIGWCLGRLGGERAPFAATKVWTPGRWLGQEQMRHSRDLWGVPRFDLMQVHNLVDWQTHLETLIAMKEAGEIRYIGVTTSHGRRHGELALVMQELPIDFVQFSYNIVDRAAERRLLPLAADRGLAVIINRPFRRGALFDRFRHHPLPGWAEEFDAANWAQFFLKFIVSHPAVTCAIPATSRVDHMQENMGALTGRLPDAKMRARMARHVAEL
ncbi:MAG: aldo/keto reductase [Rhodospirillales bacterium]|nr:MAG: aldo/keto reductase [Rhodospirillales bacterium]